MATDLQQHRLEVFQDILEKIKNLNKASKIVNKQQAIFKHFTTHYSDYPDPWKAFHDIGTHVNNAFVIVIDVKRPLSLYDRDYTKKYLRTLLGKDGYFLLTAECAILNTALENLDPFDYRVGLSEPQQMLKDGVNCLLDLAEVLIPKLAKEDRERADESLNKLYRRLNKTRCLQQK